MEWFFLFWSIFCLIVGIWALHTTASCKKKIKGVYVKSLVQESFPGKSNYYAPVFRYFIEDKEYEQQSLQSFPEEVVEKMYSPGEEYYIYITEKNPKRLVVQKKRQISRVFLIIACGVLMLGISVIGFVVKYS